MSLLNRIDATVLRDALAALKADGWLLYDFHGVNPVLGRVVGIGGMATRRLFVWLPADGTPVALAHRIELQPLADFPGEVRPYAAWEELHRELERLVRGRRVAMEISQDDAVPYLDRVPAGVVQLVERLGGSVVSSADLVTTFSARWSPEELEEHRATAETVARIARQTLDEVVHETGRAREAEVQRRVVDRMTEAGLIADHTPIVAFGPNSANPHYEPRQGSDRVLAAGEVVLLDLWGGPSLASVFADQTWMAFAGASPPPDVAGVWEIVRSAREAAIELLQNAMHRGEPVTGADVDRAARGVITRAGYGDAFVHRTGHSIDVELHGSGPHLDSFETNDTRVLMDGIGFSIEPGVYLAGRFGVRSEVNVALAGGKVEVTPGERQQELILQG